MDPDAVTYFRTDLGVEDLARTWNEKGPYRWELRENDRGDYIMAVFDGHKVKVIPDRNAGSARPTPP